jgi:CDP-glucose 4,6-dehydratase
MNKNFFYKKKILITGIDGFVGSNLAKKLVFLGAKVSGIIQKKNKKSLFNYEKINKKCTLYKGDIYNHIFIKRIITNNKFEIIFHLAAQVEVGVANHDPFDTWESNIRGTYTILNNLVKNKNIKSVIVASSDKSYGEYPKSLLPYKEHYTSRAIFPYDVSKACADMISKSYSSDLFKLPIITTRFSNIFGPGQLHFSALIPDIMKSLILNKKFIPRGDGSDLRDYVYINDIVDLYLLLSKNLYKKPKLRGEIFNAGINKPISVKEVISKFYLAKNKKEELKIIFQLMKSKKSKGEIPYQYMDHKKLKKYFGWKPKYKFDETVNDLFEWYEKYLINNKNA